MDMVGKELKEFRSELMTSKSPKQLMEVLKHIKPPKGVHRKNQKESQVPADEGDELYDCEGKDLEVLEN